MTFRIHLLRYELVLAKRRRDLRLDRGIRGRSGGSGR